MVQMHCRSNAVRHLTKTKLWVIAQCLRKHIRRELQKILQLKFQMKYTKLTMHNTFS